MPLWQLSLFKSPPQYTTLCLRPMKVAQLLGDGSTVTSKSFRFFPSRLCEVQVRRKQLSVFSLQLASAWRN